VQEGTFKFIKIKLISAAKLSRLTHILKGESKLFFVVKIFFDKYINLSKKHLTYYVI